MKKPTGTKTSYQARIYVTLKKSVLDPQGQTIQHALHSIGAKHVSNVRVGKYFELSLQAASKEEAQKRLKAICEDVLINPVIEEYSYDLIEVKAR